MPSQIFFHRNFLFCLTNSRISSNNMREYFDYVVYPKNCGQSYKGEYRNQILNLLLKYECGVRQKLFESTMYTVPKISYNGIPLCERNSKTMNELLDWCAMPDPAICPNSCGHFYKGINRKKLLRRHMVYECGTPSKFECPICTKRFTRKSNMKTHVFSVHRSIVH